MKKIIFSSLFLFFILSLIFLPLNFIKADTIALPINTVPNSASELLDLFVELEIITPEMAPTARNIADILSGDILKTNLESINSDISNQITNNLNNITNNLLPINNLNSPADLIDLFVQTGIVDSRDLEKVNTIINLLSVDDVLKTNLENITDIVPVLSDLESVSDLLDVFSEAGLIKDNMLDEVSSIVRGLDTNLNKIMNPSDLLSLLNYGDFLKDDVEKVFDDLVKDLIDVEKLGFSRESISNLVSDLKNRYGQNLITDALPITNKISGEKAINWYGGYIQEKGTCTIDGIPVANYYRVIKCAPNSDVSYLYGPLDVYVMTPLGQPYPYVTESVLGNSTGIGYCDNASTRNIGFEIQANVGHEFMSCEF